MSITIEQLTRFCDDSRTPIMHPFSDGSWTYATDGKMIIRVPRLAEVPEYDDSSKKIDSGIFQTNPITGDWFKIPSGFSNEPNKCDKCKGTGECRCKCGHVHDCEYCEGSGLSPKETPIAVGNQFGLGRLAG